MKIKNYLLNCFLLIIPVFLWNILFADYLPQIYFSEVPNKFIEYSENILRVLVFGLPLIMTLSIKTRIEKIGLVIYLFGLTIYFGSWLAIIVLPESTWSASTVGFMAPAYTTILFFIGIGLIGNKSFFRISKLSISYIAIAILFVVVHSLHTYVIFQNR